MVLKRTIIFIALGLLIFSAHAGSASVSQGFVSDEELGVGSIVSLDPSRSQYIIKSNTSNINDLLGVVAGSGGALLFTGSDSSNTEVVTGGEALVLVSDLNGSLDAGDKITVSPLSGVGMKTVSRVKVIGTAQEGFDGTGDNVQSISITDSNGEEKDVAVGLIRAYIGIHEHTPDPSSSNPFFVALQDAAQTVTGRQISLARTLIASGVVISTLIVVVMLLMGATQGTMISLGRNPLAKRTIFSTMVKFVLVSVFIFTGGIVAAYFILIT